MFEKNQESVTYEQPYVTSWKWAIHTAAKGHLVFKISFDSNTEMGTDYIITSPLKESNDLLLMKTLFLIFA